MEREPAKEEALQGATNAVTDDARTSRHAGSDGTRAKRARHRDPSTDEDEKALFEALVEDGLVLRYTPVEPELAAKLDGVAYVYPAIGDVFERSVLAQIAADAIVAANTATLPESSRVTLRALATAINDRVGSGDTRELRRFGSKNDAEDA